MNDNKLSLSILVFFILTIVLLLSSSAGAYVNYPLENGLSISYPKELGDPEILDSGELITIKIPRSNNLVVTLPDKVPLIMTLGNEIIVRIPKNDAPIRIAFPKGVEPIFPTEEEYPTIYFPTPKGLGKIKHIKPFVKPEDRV